MTDIQQSPQQSVSRALRHERDHHEDVKEDYIKTKQSEVSIAMRERVVEWLLAVCEEEQCQPQLFCLTVNCLDRILSIVDIKASQLQLAASACLLVSWKIQDHAPISAVRIVKFTNYGVKIEELLEWEVFVLSKLNWNIPSVVATHFVEHILQRVCKLHYGLVVDSMTHSKIQSLIFLCHINYHLSRNPPAVLAAAAVLEGLKDALTMETEPVGIDIDTPPPSSLSSSNTSSPELSRLTPGSKRKKSPFRVSESPIARVSRISGTCISVSSPEIFSAKSSDMDALTKSVQRITFVDRGSLSRCAKQLQQVNLKSKLPPSPSFENPTPSSPSPCPDTCKLESRSSATSPSSSSRFSTSSPLPGAARSLFNDLETFKTPTKILDASTSFPN